MSMENMPVEKRLGFNITSVSIFKQLLGAGTLCSLLWVAIAATIGV
ncbi:MAG: hypothetical protein QNJ29_13890 [Rhizobiaceae bacterium]|nr:hypothetical protein [Rhizobiaceae bacterium]